MMNEKKPDDRLVLNTKKSLYDPIEIVIDGKTYQSLKTTRAVTKEIDKLDEGVEKENAEALYKIVQLMFNIDMKVLEALDKKEVEDIYIFIKKKFVDIERERQKLVLASFGGAWAEKGKTVKRVISKNRTRSGKKR